MKKGYTIIFKRGRKITNIINLDVPTFTDAVGYLASHINKSTDLNDIVCTIKKGYTKKPKRLL